MNEQIDTRLENNRCFYVFHARNDKLPAEAKEYLRPYDSVTVGACFGRDYDAHTSGTEQDVDWTCDIYPSLKKAMDDVRDYDLSTVTFLSGEGDDKLSADELKFVSKYINEHYEMLASPSVFAAEAKNYPRTTLRHIAYDRLGEKLAKCKENGLEVDAALAPDRMISNEYEQDLVSVSGQENRSCDVVFQTQAKNTYRFSTKAVSDMTRADITNDEMRDKLNACLTAIHGLEDLAAGISPDFSLSEEEQLEAESEIKKEKEEKLEKDKLMERIRVAENIITPSKTRDRQMSM